MPVSRKDVHLYLHDLDRFYHCFTKQPYFAILMATRAAYLLSEFRSRDYYFCRYCDSHHTRDYEPYLCKYCNSYHIGRVKCVRLVSQAEMRSSPVIC